MGCANMSRCFWGSNIHLVQVGVDLDDFLKCLNDSGTKSRNLSDNFIHLVKIFAEEAYMLWIDTRRGKTVIMLKESATSETQAKSFCHAVRCSSHPQLSTQHNERNDTIGLISATLQQNRDQWATILDQARQAGWDLNLTNLVKGRGRRIRLGSGFNDNKKDK